MGGIEWVVEATAGCEIDKVASAIQSYVTSAGILVGAVWALFHFGIFRHGETALTIDPTYSTTRHPMGGFLTLVKIRLKNVGKVRIEARKRKGSFDCVATEGPGHKHKYALGLKVRPAWEPKSDPPYLNWYDWREYTIHPTGNSGWTDRPTKEVAKAWRTPTGELEFDALTGFVTSRAEFTEKEPDTDFWIEPGEDYTMCLPLTLKAGTYIALVTFIGENKQFRKSGSEYWQRTFLLEVPS